MTSITVFPPSRQFFLDYFMLLPVWKKNDSRARILIISVSLIVFIAIVVLSRTKLNVSLGFDEHIFAKINAVINSTVSVLLIAGLVSVKNKRYLLHKRIMLSAMLLSCLFLLSYICHHLFAGETKFGGQGTIRYIYYFILGTHVVLAGIILPFILFTAYRALTGEWARHKKLAKITWPIWLYVAITGVLVYVMISPYYS
jgi:putative membrane protein